MRAPLAPPPPPRCRAAPLYKMNRSAAAGPQLLLLAMIVELLLSLYSCKLGHQRCCVQQNYSMDVFSSIRERAERRPRARWAHVTNPTREIHPTVGSCASPLRLYVTVSVEVAAFLPVPRRRGSRLHRLSAGVDDSEPPFGQVGTVGTSLSISFTYRSPAHRVWRAGALSPYLACYRPHQLLV
ncbi:hypothetical protein EVAR_9721_1 [Eumeta japonica]|uniref:Uncharacterized protein n=1 Tax=Eumeta variegata TaxID=151549 RepID=A0A4C1U5J5_EUMVA|nr:hypothetical protein EVAR_9721_1 [Eumeta japonica]